MTSTGEYKTVSDVISDLNVMIVEAPVSNSVWMFSGVPIHDAPCRGGSPPQIETGALGPDQRPPSPASQPSHLLEVCDVRDGNTSPHL